MVKAVDGGGGRGIRLIRDEESLPSAVKLAVAESPSKKLFAEKAAIDGFRHIEVQIIGDGNGGVTHLWERECSIQRRYQKVIELAPSVVPDRRVIAKVIEDALRMAKHVRLQELLRNYHQLIKPDPLLLPWYLRVSCKPINTRILLPRS
jgi:pyruvate carboxylase